VFNIIIFWRHWNPPSLGLKTWSMAERALRAAEELHLTMAESSAANNELLGRLPNSSLPTIGSDATFIMI
jgi:hypothetical protein